MMKPIIFLSVITIILLGSCGQQNSDTKKMQQQIDSLQHKLENTFRPGLGEFMSGIQVHHAKLWFAGQAQNWKLAEFEVNEISEALAGIKQYNTGRPEVKSITLIEPAIDSISNAIKQESQVLFNSSYVLLTNTCNNCHRATKHEFNVVKIPDAPPFSNQDFKVQ